MHAEAADLDALLGSLTERGVSLWAEGDALKFRAPVEAMTGADREVLRRHKPALLELLRHRRAAPLSSVQRRLWFLSRFAGDTPAYTVAMAYRLRGPLDRARFDAALSEILARHPALSATFSEHGGRPVQWLGRPIPVRSRIDQASTLEEMRATAVRPFDLARGPLLRSFLFEVDPETTLWTLTAHHLVLDGFSMGHLVRELSDLYAGRALSSPEASYLDWIEAQETADTGEHLDWWQRALSDLPRLELPLDHTRPPVRTYAGRMHAVELDPDLSRDLERLLGARGHTLFTGLLTIFSVLLSRYAGQDDVAVGSPWANRQAGYEAVLGVFVSTLIMRCRADPALTLTDMLERTRRFFLDAADHASVSFEELVSHLEPERDTSRSPIFQTFFALQDAFTELELSGISAEWVDFDTGIVQFDLELHCFRPRRPGGGLKAVWLYNSDLFDDGTIRRMAERFNHLARELVRGPDRPIGSIPLLTPSDREWYARLNATGAPVPDAPVEEQIRRRAEEDPDEIALVSRGRRITRSELERRVARLAARLAHAPPGPIGLYTSRSVEMVVGLLAILRAARAFVPLDPEYPRPRLSYMVEQSGTSLVLGTPGTRALGGAVEVLDPSEERGPAEEQGGARPAPKDLAYVIYTSGSTGQPKGVAVTRDNLRACLSAFSSLVEPSDVFVAVTTLSFDIAILEILLPLARGARLVVATEEEIRDGRRLASLLAVEEATVMQATPATYQLLLDAGWAGNVRALCGGEPLPRPLADRLAACAELWNMYGPTETTIWSSSVRLERGESVVLGPPAANTRFFVVDDQGALCPPDVPGELFIAGRGVAEGYLHRPDLTTERFVEYAGERCYRTGDLVRARPDGTLLFLGRKDHQLKVRGYRIEPAEVEAALLVHRKVHDTVVVAVPSADGALLVAYLATEEAIEPTEIRRFLLDRLPAYMVPSCYVPLRALPRLPNGKIDRSALPPPSAGGTSQSDDAPFGPVERSVAEVFAHVLGVDRVGRSVDFFAVGGQSLLAVQVLAELSQRFRVALSFPDFFVNPTVEGLAERIGRARVERILTSSEAEVAAELDRLTDEEAAHMLALIQAET